VGLGGVNAGDLWARSLADRVIWVLEGVFWGNRAVAGEITAAFWAEHHRESPRFFGRKGIDDDVFDPISVVT
jgi:hypothetical protein